MVTNVRSADGTQIALTQSGSGPTIVLVGGNLDDGAENAPLAGVLARDFHVINYSRRGRGRSGDTKPYAVVREIEDLAALIGVVGKPVFVFGASSGGALALEAAFARLPIAKLAIYEAPYDTAPGTAEGQADYVSNVTRLLAEGDREGALALFMRMAGSSEDDIEGARQSKWWPGLIALAPTLAYDALVLGSREVPFDRLRNLVCPLAVVTGGQAGPFEHSADAIAGAPPRGERIVLGGQGHVADPEVLGAALKRFFTA